LEPSGDTPGAPVDWFHFGGKWGDKMYKASDKRQWMVAGQYRELSYTQEEQVERARANKDAG